MNNEYDNNNTNSEVSENEQADVKPVKLSRFATAVILIAGCLILIILIITVRSCTIEKKVNSSGNTGSSNVVTEIATENNEIAIDSSSISTEFVTLQTDPVPTSAEKGNTPTSENTPVTEGSSDGLSEVVVPAFGNELETKGIVISKHAYTFNGSYVYGVNISMLVGDTTQTVQYFCPKKTYDALSSTDTVVVLYQQDSTGAVSVSSISK